MARADEEAVRHAGDPAAEVRAPGREHDEVSSSSFAPSAHDHVVHDHDVVRSAAGDFHDAGRARGGRVAVDERDEGGGDGRGTRPEDGSEERPP